MDRKWGGGGYNLLQIKEGQRNGIFLSVCGLFRFTIFFVFYMNAHRNNINTHPAYLRDEMITINHFCS